MHKSVKSTPRIEKRSKESSLSHKRRRNLVQNTLRPNGYSEQRYSSYSSSSSIRKPVAFPISIKREEVFENTYSLDPADDTRPFLGLRAPVSLFGLPNGSNVTPLISGHIVRILLVFGDLFRVFKRQGNVI